MSGGDARPLLSFDLDGVLARPLPGASLTMNRHVDLQPIVTTRVPRRERAPSLADRILANTYYRVRYAGRGVLPGALDALTAAAGSYRIIVLSGRSFRGRARTEAWLDRHGLLAPLDAVVLNDTGLASPHFKRLVAADMGIVRHVDDDAATAALLARTGLAVDLIDWPRNRGLSYPAGVTRRDGLADLARALRTESDADRALRTASHVEPSAGPHDHHPNAQPPA